LVPPMIALVVLAIPSVLVGTHAGISSIDAAVIDAARAQGFTTRQLVTRMHLHLDLAMIVVSIRYAVIQIMSTAIRAAYVGAGVFGRFRFVCIYTQDSPILLGASVLIMVLVIIYDTVFGLIQRLATPTEVYRLHASPA